ncbi:methyl-accepting chemotaxis protein [Roseofilum capinflatum]|uniref:Methyl-accepting chemotaxis protein n=1 Tax=Roseofilum capinflatum BLCC-M114 TaxID=3022440 RepID=A0ABT7BBG0_9CYAN|nr:methyl-accepting chemotaxis protein [Roseofilum capinflatum]MDJ1176520.1 methyl-accepting chemotaxis protein [Roseofilum capinflatum BLCC-M114]
MKISTRLILSYGLMTGLVVGTSLYNLFNINRLAQLTTELYEHPYTVSTSVLRVESGIVKMHRSMKDVALAKTPQGIVQARTQVDRYEQQVYAEFDRITQQFLGDPQKIYEVRQKFSNWKPIRDEVIQLMQAGQAEEAANITQEKGADYVESLVRDVQDIIDFAENKAQEFLEEAKKARSQVIVNTLILLIVFALSSIIVGGIITNSIRRSLAEAIQINNQLFQGNLQTNIKVNTQDEVGQLMNSVEHMVENFKSTLLQVQTVSNSVAMGSKTMKERAMHMASGVTEQAASTEEASTSIHHIVDSIRQNTSYASETLNLASKASGDAQETRESMLAALEVMKAIADKIGVVEQIALQTNVLALNSSIEAARSQESEKGFSVVAAEVRRLATRTRNAASEINQLASSSLIGIAKAETLLNQLFPGIERTNQLVEKISLVSTDQLQGSNQINQAIVNLDEVNQQNAQLANDLSQLSQDLAEQAEELKEMISFFKVD